MIAASVFPGPMTNYMDARISFPLERLHPAGKSVLEFHACSDAHLTPFRQRDRIDPETQKTTAKIDAIRLLPAHEFPLDEEGVKTFRHRYRERFEGNPQKSIIYSSVSSGARPR